MINYEQIRSWYQDKENKQKMVYGACFVLVFIIGFGTGRVSEPAAKQQTAKQSYYTTKTGNEQAAAPKPKVGEGTVKGVSVSDSPCLIKGNINAKGGKIYHVPGGASYKITKAEQCFKTEAEAQAAGFTKSSR